MVRNNPQESVLILEAHARASLPILESCKSFGLNTIAASSQKYCCGFFSKAAAEKIVYPPVESKPDECFDFLIDFLRQRQISVLFPVGDIMTDLIAFHQDKIKKYTKFILPPYATFIHGRNKILTLKAAQRCGCPTPATWLPAETPITQIAQEANYPVLIKPAISCGARGIVLCKTPHELLESFPKIEQDFGDSYIQEKIPNTGKQYKVDAVVDASQQLIAAVAYAKLRYYPPEGGSSVLNKTEYRPDIIQCAYHVLSELKWVGFCDFDFIIDPKDNSAKLLEINPRYPESFRATVAAGINVTQIMYQLAKGEKPEPRLYYNADRYMRFLIGDIMWFLTTKENRWKSKPFFFDFFRSDTFYQFLRANDPGPIIGYLLQNISVLWNRKVRDFRLRRKS